MTFRVTYSVLDADMSELHAAFDSSLATVKSELGQDYRIAGQAHRGQWLEDRNPADTRQLLGRFAVLDTADLDTVVSAAKKAQSTWGKTPWQERVQLLRRAGELISERRLRLAAIMALETGKNRLEALGDVEEAADLCRYYATQLEEAAGFARPLTRLSPKEDTRDVLKPYGVFAVLSPFNFPMALATGMAAAALLGGNSVVLKPSDETPWTAYELSDIFADAGLPAAVFQVVFGIGRDLGAALVGHRSIDGVAFTGSHAVGMDIMHHFSPTFAKPCLLEMGGKNPAIVCADADIAMAAVGCARSAFGLSGQKCSALSRIYVHSSKKAEFIERLIGETKKLKIGDPTVADVYMGPVINARAVTRFDETIATLKKDGHILHGGERLPANDSLSHGHFVSPTIATVPRGHALWRTELFLPLVLVDRFDTLEEAVAQGNDCDYGLTAGIYSNKASDVEYFMDHIEAGILYANRPTGATTGAWPGVQSFCGWKGSGSTGKGGCGPYYVSQFMREQSQTRM